MTRPQPGSTQTVAALKERGHEPIATPLLQIETLSPVDSDAGPWSAILLTSANALGSVADLARRDGRRTIPIFAVGDRTAKAACDQGFTDVTSAAGNVNDLANLVAERLKPPARLLYPSGEERSGDLAGALRAKNFILDVIVVYRIVAVRALPEAAAAAIRDGVDGVFHFSRRSAETFVKAAGNAGLLEIALARPIHYCLSGQVAQPLRAAGATDIRIAARPDEVSLLELCG